MALPGQSFKLAARACLALVVTLILLVALVRLPFNETCIRI